MMLANCSPDPLESAVPHVHTRRDVAIAWLARRAWRLVGVVVVSSAALGAAALPGGSPRAGAVVVSPAQIRGAQDAPSPPSVTAEPRDDVPAQTDAPDQPEAPAAVPHAR